MAEEIKVDFKFTDGETVEKAFGDKTLKMVEVSTDKDTYVNALKDNDLDIKIVKKVEQFNEHYLKAATKAATIHNTELFNKGIEATQTVLPIGISSRNSITIDSKKDVTIPKPGVAGETITGPQVRVAVKTTYTKLSSSYIKSMKDLISESLANG